MQRDYAHEITVDRPLADAIPLFTPKGEEAWVPGWRPRYIRPESGETGEEMIFLTEAGDETTVWTCLAWQPEHGHVRYLRLTPGSRVAFVDVRCRADGADRTRVRVSYQIIALSAEGRSYLEGFSAADFAASIDGWAALIRDNM